MEEQKLSRDWVTGQGLKAKWEKYRAGTADFEDLGRFHLGFSHFLMV